MRVEKSSATGLTRSSFREPKSNGKFFFVLRYTLLVSGSRNFGRYSWGLFVPLFSLRITRTPRSTGGHHRQEGRIFRNRWASALPLTPLCDPADLQRLKRRMMQARLLLACGYRRMPASAPAIGLREEACGEREIGSLENHRSFGWGLPFVSAHSGHMAITQRPSSGLAHAAGFFPSALSFAPRCHVAT